MIGKLTRKLPKTPNFVYRDHLTKNDEPSLPKKLQRSPKIVDIYREKYFDGVPDLKEPLLSLDDVHDHEVSFSKGKELRTNSDSNSRGYTKSGNIRVKVLMTKKEAEKLLSKCKENNSLEFKDVMSELSRLPAQRIDVISVGDDDPCRGPCKALSTIHEED